jgi:uroporphyrinogen-III synthase
VISAQRLERRKVWLTCSPRERETLSFLLEDEGAEVCAEPPLAGDTPARDGLRALAERPLRTAFCVVDGVASFGELEAAAREAGTLAQWRALALACPNEVVARTARLSGWNVRVVHPEPALLARAVLAATGSSDAVAVVHDAGSPQWAQALRDCDGPVSAVALHRSGEERWRRFLEEAPPDLVVFTSAAAVGRLEESVGTEAVRAWLGKVRPVAAGRPAREALAAVGGVPVLGEAAADEALVEEAVALISGGRA